MLEHKFRGLNKFTNKWVYFTLQDAMITWNDYGSLQHITRWTGVRDIKGNEVYGGDILHINDDGDYTYNTLVKDEQGILCIDVQGRDYVYIPPQWLEDHVEFEVIGNEFQNKELLNA